MAQILLCRDRKSKMEVGMANHIQGPLYYEKMGRSGPVMAFVHPNPMDQSCWIFQMAAMSTWYRCIAIDIPGYGRSPKADKGLTMEDMAQACWEAVDDAFPGENAILVGCSVGSSIVPYMHHQRPSQSPALILCGTGYTPGKEFARRRIKAYSEQGIDYRWDYTFQDFSPAFRQTQMAHYFADLFTARNPHADVDSIIYQFETLGAPDADDHHMRVKSPTIILTGSEDGAHASSFALKERIPGCELRVLPGAGHACQIEQPWLFNKFMVEFLEKQGLHPK
jgi:3-oxoadipate enol-lactonase